MLRNEILHLTAQNDITTQPLDPASGQIHSGFRLSTEGREWSDSIAEGISAQWNQSRIPPINFSAIFSP
jgi:hypothetical protein